VAGLGGERAEFLQQLLEAQTRFDDHQMFDHHVAVVI